MKKKMLTVVAFVVLIASGVQAQESGGDMETWHCFDIADFSQEKVLFSLTRKGAGGEVLFAGLTYPARFQIAGLNRRWDFGDDESKDKFLYAVIISPEGTGKYVDSSDGRVSRSQFFTCLLSP